MAFTPHQALLPRTGCLAAPCLATPYPQQPHILPLQPAAALPVL